MGRILILLLAASIAGPGQRDEPDRKPALLLQRVDDRRAGPPTGQVDQPLLEVADMAPADLDTVAAPPRRSRSGPCAACSEERNDLLRRGALVHTDIALLLPAQRGGVSPDRPSSARSYFDHLREAVTRRRREPPKGLPHARRRVPAAPRSGRRTGRWPACCWAPPAAAQVGRVRAALVSRRRCPLRGEGAVRQRQVPARPRAGRPAARPRAALLRGRDARVVRVERVPERAAHASGRGGAAALPDGA